MEEPLDFEKEDLLFLAPRLTSKRKKVIGLDDLLTDFCGGKNKAADKSSRHSKPSKGYDSDDDDRRVRENETYLHKFVEQCEKQVNEIGSEDEVPVWGLRAFGIQKAFPPSEKLVTVQSDLFRHCKETDFISLFDSNGASVEKLLENLLSNGWLSQLVATGISLEESIASWTFHTMLYSTDEDLHVSACDLWCVILLSGNKGDQLLAKVKWIPSYSVLKDALSNYGYLWPTCNNDTGRGVSQGCECEGPPLNICSWIRALSACCQIRDTYQIFSGKEMEELLEVIIWFYLDRHLLGLALELNECLYSIVHYFLDDEWEDSCSKVAKSIALRVPKDLNCLRAVECITGADNRTKYFRSQLALHLLLVCFDNEVKSGEGVLKRLASVDIKGDSSCDFFKLYIYLVLAENLLLLYQPLHERSTMVNLWCKYLRNCSTQITSTDWRSYASKVRNKASYLLQNMTVNRSH